MSEQMKIRIECGQRLKITFLKEMSTLKERDLKYLGSKEQKLRCIIIQWKSELKA